MKLLNLIYLNKVFKNHFFFVLFLLFYILFALSTYKDFGITWDENEVYSRGKLTLHYYKSKINYNDYLNSLGSVNKLYSPAYSAMLNYLNKKQNYALFHLLNLLFSLPLFVFSYFILNKNYKEKAVLGPIFLFLTPRLLGHIPANPKDVPFATSFFISLSLIYLLRKTNNILVKVLILGLVFGITVSLRTIGFSIFFIYLLFSLYRNFPYKLFKNIKQFLNEILALLIIFIIANLVMVVSWPFLGANYLNIFEVLNNSKNFPWYGNVLYFGEYIKAPQLPWHYLFVWISISTPIPILIFFLLSFIKIKNLFKNELCFLFLSSFLINVIFYLVLKPVIYDGLRHFLFLVPLIVIISIIFMLELLKSLTKKSRFMVKFFVAIYFILVVFNMVKLHPYEYIYFNELVGGLRGAYQKFETDYWGASFKEAVEWLKSNELKNKDKVYKIYTCANPFQSYYYFSQNMSWVNDINKADYFICYTRNKENELIKGKTIYIVKRDNIPLNYVKKIK